MTALPPQVNPTLPLGKTPARHDRRDIHLDAVVDLEAVLPKVPAQFGHEQGLDWGMLANDRAGDCVLAGAAHETMLWTLEGNGAAAQFTDQTVLADYAAITGYDPVTGANDNGTDVRNALLYRRDTGITDAHGARHKIGAFLALEPGNHDHLLAALYLFGAVGIGIEFPATAMDQFNHGQPWRVVARSAIEGGHYIPLVARRHRRLECVTWGKTQPMTVGFYARYCDEAYAILSPEMLHGGRTPEGFDQAALNKALAAL